MKTKTKNQIRDLLSFTSILLLLLAVGAAVFACAQSVFAQTNDAPAGVAGPPGVAVVPIITLLLPILTPLLTDLVKRIFPKAPPYVVVSIAPVLGAAWGAFNDTLAAGATGGLAGIGTYKLYEKYTGGKPKAAALAGLVLLSCFGITGCAWSKANANTLINIAATVAGNAARYGAAANIAAHPENRAIYQAVVLELNAAVLQEEILGATQLEAVLSKLPVKALNGPLGVLSMEGGLLIYQLTSETLFSPQTITGVKRVATAIRDGLVAALAAPPTPPLPPAQVVLPPHAKAIRI